MTKHLPPSDRPTEPMASGRRRSFSARFLDSADTARQPAPETSSATVAETSPQSVASMRALPSPEAVRRGDAERAFAAFDRELASILAERGQPSATPPAAPNRGRAAAELAAFDAELDTEISAAADRAASRAAAAEEEAAREAAAAQERAERAAAAAAKKQAERDAAAAAKKQAERDAAAAAKKQAERDVAAGATEQAAHAAAAEAAAPPVSALGEMLDDADWRRLERAARHRRRKPGAQALDEVELLDEDVDDDRFEFELAADRDGDDLALGADIARQRRVAVALASAGIAAAVMVALMAAPDDANQAAGVAPTTVAALAEDGDPFPIEATPTAAPSAAETAAIQTASVASGYLSRDAMIALLRARPVKCVLPTPPDAPVEAAVLEPALRSSRAVCAETVDYRAEGVLFTQRSRVEGDAVLEVNAPYSLEGAALCHHTRDLSALVIGDDVPLARKVSLERLVKSNYAATPGGRICYKFRPLFGAGGEVAYGADVFVNGVISPERTDPRPFLMRRRD